MDKIQLGKTDLQVTRICFGCWQLSPTFWGDIPQDEWRQSVRAALECGVNFIDTADAYGDGFAEESLGALLKEEGTRDQFVIATKFYWNFLKGQNRYPDTRYEYILQACEASLRRLKIDTIDLYQIHAWDPLTRPDEVAAAFAKLKKDGKVRWFGVSNLNVEQMKLYAQYTDIECLQPPYSLLSRDIEARELPHCQQNRIGVIAYSPLYRGLLTGKYSRDEHFTDSRQNNPLFQAPAFHRILDALDSLQPFCEKYALTMPQLAIRWILTHPAVSCAIVGVKKPDHIQSIVPAANGQLDIEDWHAIGRIIAEAKREATDK